MKLRKRFILSAVTANAGLTASIACGQFQSSGTDFSPVNVGGKVVTNAHNDALGTDTTNVRVSGYFFQSVQDDPNFTQDPGFNTPANGLPAGSTLSFSILDSLKYYNGVGPITLSAPVNNESLIYNFALTNRTLNGSSGVQSGFNIGAVTSGGALHKHLNAFLTDSTGSYNPSASPTPGVYVSQFRMNDTSLISSDPIFNVYDNGLPNAAVDRVKFYLRNNFAPGSNLVQNITSMVGLSAQPGEANLATGGQVTVTNTGSGYSSEIDELTANANKGSVALNSIPSGKTMLAMLWLNGSTGDVSRLISDLNIPEAYDIAPVNVSAANPLYADIQSLLPNYPGFSALVEFAPAANNQAFTWDFSADQNVLLDKFAAVPKLIATFSGQWIAASSGTWGVSGNWLGGQVPTTPGDTATFASGPTSALTVLLDSNRSIGHLVFNNATSYTIGAGGGVLTIDNIGGTGSPDITVAAGSHTIAAPINLANGLTLSISPGTALSIAGSVSGVGPLIKTGGGSTTLSGSNSYSVGLNVSAGTLIFAAPNALPAYSALSIGAGASAIAAIHAAANPKNALFVTGLAIAGSTGAWTGRLDLANNDLDLRGGSLATVCDQLKEGFNATGSGLWNGPGGIVSSAAANDLRHLTALAAIYNSVDGTTSGSPLYGSGTTMGLFDAANPSASDVLVKYTYYGDANLDGRVDGSDYSRIDNGFSQQLTGWFNGDFNYDGIVNGSDYTLIDNAFNTQGAAITDMIATPTARIAAAPVIIASNASVPEPVGGIACAALCGTLARRHKPRTGSRM